MRKSTMAFVAMTMIAGMAMAAPVSEAVARMVAINFWNTYRPVTSKPVEMMQTRAYSELQNMYVFANEEEGFVIVAADDRVRPVLGYGFDAPFPTRLHPELRYWLSCYERQIEVAKTVDGAADPRWATLLNGEVPPQPVSLTSVAALCSTRWDQGDPYNRLCPYDSVYDSRTVVGCVATAMAQIMKRWNYPSCGTGSHSYSHQGMAGGSSYGILSADFANTTYLWQYMSNVITYATPARTANAVSVLSYHCGVAVDMMYGPSATGGSGAYSACYPNWGISYCATRAFVDFFKYQPTLHYENRDSYSDSAWLSFIDAELEAGRPMYYDGSDNSGGHAFVLDGSNLDTTYHFNWGWSGYGDGFYTINNLAPGSGGAGGNATYTFNHDQGAIFGIEPVGETFDTVDVYDTVCNDATEYCFYEYTLPVANGVNQLRHLNTIYNVHLAVVNTSEADFSSNIGSFGQVFTQIYCYVDSLLMPECPYTRAHRYFAGWCQNKQGHDTIYQPGEKAKVHGYVLFYAIWRDSSTLGIREVEDNLSMWPNPTSGELYIELGDEPVAQVKVLDAVGREVLSETYPRTMHREVKISMQNLPAGIYTVQLKTATGLYNRRIIKR